MYILDHHCLRGGHHSSEDAAGVSSPTDRSRCGKQSDRLITEKSWNVWDIGRKQKAEMGKKVRVYGWTDSLYVVTAMEES